MRFIFAFLSLATAAFAGDSICIRTTSRECGPQGCSIIVGHGSGVVLSRSDKGVWAVITAAHVVRGLEPQHVSVGLASGWKPISNIYRLDTADDAAFITFTDDGPLKTNETTDEEIPPGTPIMFSGFSDGKKFEQSQGRLIHDGLAVVDTRPKGGQSGGAVCRLSDGRLIGVLSGYDPAGRLTYTPVCRVRRQCLHQWGFWWGINIGLPPAYPPAQISGQPPPGPPGPQGPAGTDGKSADTEELKAMRAMISQLITEQRALKTEITALKTVVGKADDAARILYFTSRNISRVNDTDALARALKQAGKRITIVTLDPKDIDESNVRDVPRVYVLPGGRSVVGVDDVTKFLSDWKE